MTDYHKTLSEQLRAVIAKKGISVAVAADLWGIHRNELRGLLNRKKDVRLSTLARISDALDKPLSYLLCPEEGGARP